MLCLFLESSVESIYRFDVKIRKVIVGLSLLFVFFFLPNVLMFSKVNSWRIALEIISREWKLR